MQWKTVGGIEINNEILFFGIDLSNDLYSWNINENHQVINFKKLDGKWKQLSNSYNHLLLIDDNNQLFGIGENDRNQLGLFNNNDNVTKLTKIDGFKNVTYVKCKNLTSMIINNDRLYNFGRKIFFDRKDNFDVNFKIPCTPENLKLVDFGDDYIYILTKNNLLYSLGNNKKNKLCQGYILTRTKNFNRIDLATVQFKDIYCAKNNLNTYMLTIDGKLYVVGERCYKRNIDRLFKNYKILNLKNNYVITEDNDIFYIYINFFNKEKYIDIKVKDIFEISYNEYFLDMNNELYILKSRNDYSKINFQQENNYNNEIKDVNNSSNEVIENTNNVNYNFTFNFSGEMSLTKLQEIVKILNN